MDTTGLIDATAAPIYELGGAYCFADATAQRGERLGPRRVHVLLPRSRRRPRRRRRGDGRATRSSWFKPHLVETWWNEGRAVADPATIAVAYLEAARDYARRTFKETDALRSFAAAAARVVDAAPSGRWPLVDGYRRFALPDDVVARAFQLVVVLRELRGGAYGEAVARPRHHAGRVALPQQRRRVRAVRLRVR